MMRIGFLVRLCAGISTCRKNTDKRHTMGQNQSETHNTMMLPTFTRQLVNEVEYEESRPAI